MSAHEPAPALLVPVSLAAAPTADAGVQITLVAIVTEAEALHAARTLMSAIMALHARREGRPMSRAAKAPGPWTDREVAELVWLLTAFRNRTDAVSVDFWHLAELFSLTGDIRESRPLRRAIAFTFKCEYGKVLAPFEALSAQRRAAREER